MQKRSVARKHHYLPQSYLANFTAAGKKDSQFFVLDLKRDKSFPTNPNNVAAIRDFNRVDIDGHHPDAIENALAPFEGEAQRAIQRVIQSNKFPTDDDLNTILNLAALLAVRNPKMRDSFNAAREQTLRIISSMLASDRGLWERHMKKAMSSGEVKGDISFEKFKEFVDAGEYDYIFHPQGNLAVEFEAHDKILHALGHRTWSILTSEPDNPEFICSDHPISLAHKDDYRGPLGFALENTEVFIPLSPRIGLYGVYEDPLKPEVSCPTYNVAVLNARTFLNAESQVYSRQPFMHLLKGEEIVLLDLNV